MRKIFLVAALFLLLSFLHTKFSYAQGSFNCVPVGSTARCQPNSNMDTCDTGYIPDDSACSPFHGDAAACRGAGGTCISPAAEANKTLCPDGQSIDTAIGCIPISDTNAFIGFILRWAIGIGGGIAFLLIVYAGFMIMSSSGNPERLKAGQELLTSAIAGLIMLIFSVFILRVIGVDILGLPIGG